MNTAPEHTHPAGDSEAQSEPERHSASARGADRGAAPSSASGARPWTRPRRAGIRTTLALGLVAAAFAAGCGGSSGWNSNVKAEARAAVEKQGADRSEADCVIGVMEAHHSAEEIMKDFQSGDATEVETQLGVEAASKCNLSHVVETTPTSNESNSEPGGEDNTGSPNPSDEVTPPCSKEHPCEPGENGE